MPTRDLLRRIDALESLRHRLVLGVQESLALESGFLEMITDSRGEPNAQLSREYLVARRGTRRIER